VAAWWMASGRLGISFFFSTDDIFWAGPSIALSLPPNGPRLASTSRVLDKEKNNCHRLYTHAAYEVRRSF
jgi:hypothetical protein